MTKIAKNKEPARWLLKKRGVQATDAAVAKLKSELDVERNATASSTAGGSLGPGGRRLRTVNTGADDELFGGGDDDDDPGARRRARELGRHGDLEEVDFEDVFEDDEQTMEVDEKEDEETKEIDVGPCSPLRQHPHLTLPTGSASTRVRRCEQGSRGPRGRRYGRP
jgi:transcription initiation factor TFIIF subunit alpha